MQFKYSLIGAAMAVGLSSGAQAQEFFTIGTGGVTGVYYPAGGAICRLVNKTSSEHGFRCTVESTGGSVYNVNTIRAGELDFGVAQSDVQYKAVNGEGEFEEDGAFEDLRAVLSLHPEPFTVVARQDAGVKNFDELSDKRVNIGNPGSGQRSTIEVLLEAKGMSTDDFALATELKAAEQSAALCDNQIDAMVYVVGHPSGSIEEASTSCDSTLVNVDGDAVDTLVEENPYYRKATIPGGMYRGTDEEVTTFGVGATLVSSTDVSEDAVYALVSAVFENFDEFKSLHPAFENLKPEEMVSASLTAPLHDGAAKYYEEKGWLSE